MTVPEEGYNSWPASAYGQTGDLDPDDLELYNLRAQQTYPYVIAAWSPAEDIYLSPASAQVVCVSPRTVLGGSQMLEEVSLAERIGGRSPRVFAIIAAFVVVCLLS